MLRAVFLALILLPSTAFASSVVALPEAELLARADAVVVASVSQVECYRDAKSGIRTRALLQVHHGVRGPQEGEVLTIDVPGGTLGGQRSSVSGAPALVEGQLLLAFLEAYGSAYRPLGLSYGVYNVALRGASWRAVRDLNGLALLNRRGQLLHADLLDNSGSGNGIQGGEDLNVMLLRLQQQARALGGLK